MTAPWRHDQAIGAGMLNGDDADPANQTLGRADPSELNDMEIHIFCTVQYNAIDSRRRNSLLVRLRDRDAGWKHGCLKGRVEQMTF